MKSVELNDYPGYFLSEDGSLSIKVKDEYVEVPPQVTHVEYPYWDIQDGFGWCKVSCHRLMAMTFLPMEESCPVVDHLDGNKLNYKLDNLEWVNQSTNVTRAHRKGLCLKTTPLFIVKSIRFALRDGTKPMSVIAKEHNVTKSVVYGIKYRKRHVDVSEEYVFPLKQTKKDPS